MKHKILFSLILSISYINYSQAKDNHPVDELFPLPHPVKLIMPNKEKLKITSTQEERINNEMLNVFPPKILEDKLLLEVTQEGKTKIQLKDDIDELTRIKRELADVHIDALNTLRNILTIEQRHMVKALMKEAKQKSTKHTH